MKVSAEGAVGGARRARVQAGQAASAGVRRLREWQHLLQQSETNAKQVLEQFLLSKRCSLRVRIEHWDNVGRLVCLG